MLHVTTRGEVTPTNRPADGTDATWGWNAGGHTAAQRLRWCWVCSHPLSASGSTRRRHGPVPGSPGRGWGCSRWHTRGTAPNSLPRAQRLYDKELEIPLRPYFEFEEQRTISGQVRCPYGRRVCFLGDPWSGTLARRLPSGAHIRTLPRPGRGNWGVTPFGHKMSSRRTRHRQRQCVILEPLRPSQRPAPRCPHPRVQRMRQNWRGVLPGVGQRRAQWPHGVRWGHRRARPGHLWEEQGGLLVP